ncbi:MAG: NAD(P)/FAD-dependent oxidoreductase [Candidatus Kapaibacteriota bacterium]
MKHLIDIALSPLEASSPDVIFAHAVHEAGIDADSVTSHQILKRSIDARGKSPKIILSIALFVNEEAPLQESISSRFKDVHSGKRIIIIGAGPAGYFAGLECLLHGLKPIIVERGKDARSRRRDLRAIQQFGTVNPHSNYCFGEGGAGTYSDGKLWTNSKKRGDIRKVLQLLVEHGANERILIDTHGHIGSNKLPGIIQEIRSTIENYGGEIHFDSWVNQFLIEHNRMIGVSCANGNIFHGDAVILATGHSARDIFATLLEAGIHIESKPFAIGVRVEHPHEYIDEIRYRQSPRDPHLPASSYKLVEQVQGRGVFSFCMCPGGLIVPAATSPGEIVVNGMSMSRRDSPFANSGIVVAIEQVDLKEYEKHGPLAGLHLQSDIEQAVFASGDGSQKAPAQRLQDFLSGNISQSLPKSSYIPGLFSHDIASLFPKHISKRLQMGFQAFERSMRGYLHQEAIIVATESRTSSPVRIPRDPISREHVQMKGLYPCGEGAGYAGGIVSAAMDGQNTVQAIAQAMGVQS